MIQTHIDIWLALTDFVTVNNVATAVSVLYGVFLVWRQGTSQKAKAISEIDDATLEALTNGLKAASARADAEKERADQNMNFCTVLQTQAAEDHRTIKELRAKLKELDDAKG